MMQKLKTFKKYSTLSHQPGTPWGTLGMFMNYFQEVHFVKNYI